MLTVLILLGTTAALSVGGCVVYRSRRAEKMARVLFRCPACGQKLRCLASKAGRPGMCPRCRERWTLPAVTQELTAQTTPCGSYRIGRSSFNAGRRLARR
jgi:DNA-directed RNA polymerase subunit RPC12/RpoP